MDITYKTKYNIGDSVVVTGYDNRTGEVVPALAKVAEIKLEKHSKEHPWLLTYTVNKYADDGICLGYSYPPGEEDENLPIYEAHEFEGEMFMNVQDWHGWLDEDPF